MKGGPDSLRKVLSYLKSRHFTGYVKVTRSDEDKGSGIMALEAGRVRQVVWEGPSLYLQGREALEAVSRAAREPQATLEVHALPHAPHLSGEAPPAPAPRWEAKVAAWRARGFRTSAVEELEGKPGAEGALQAFEARVGRCEKALETLGTLEGGPLVTEVERLKSRALDPMEIEAVEAALEELLVRFASPTEQTPSPSRSPPGGEGNLVGRYTFEAFVAGPPNRFALAAAMAVAKKPDGTYNPLFFVSGPGLGKTHLLHAIGNHVRTTHPGVHLLYVPAEAFCNELREAAKGDRLVEFRQRYRCVDLLMVDDVQFLCRDPAAQEEFFHTFNALHSAGKQMVLASELPPQGIPSLEARLASRFESGLVVDIQPPDQETKVAILRRKALQGGASLSPTVLHRLARLVRNNVRELEGLLNRLLAHSSLLGKPVTEGLVQELSGGTAAPSPAPTDRSSPRPDLRPGGAILLEEEKPGEILRLAAEASGDRPSLVITRINPTRVRGLHTWGSGAQVLWLTDRGGPSVETIPPSLERIISTLEAFLERSPEGTVALDGVEYLVSNNGFDSVLKFLRAVVDQVAVGRQTLLVSLNPQTLEPRQVSTLEREMAVMRVGTDR